MGRQAKEEKEARIFSNLGIVSHLQLVQFLASLFLRRRFFDLQQQQQSKLQQQ